MRKIIIVLLALATLVPFALYGFERYKAQQFLNHEVERTRYEAALAEARLEVEQKAFDERMNKLDF